MDHTETTQIDFDPKTVSYAQLLDIFWDGHSPCSSHSTQYASIIFYHNEEQRKLAESTKEKFAAKEGHRVFTRITPYERFYLAEDYHQKYYLRGHDEMMEPFTDMPLQEFVDSPVVARLNGYIGGHGTPAMLKKELPSYKLSERMQKYLQARIGHSRSGCMG